MKIIRTSGKTTLTGKDLIFAKARDFFVTVGLILAYLFVRV